MKKTDKKIGAVFVKEVEGHLGLNWGRLGIPLEIATVELRGKGVDYSNLEKESVEEIRIGYGYRKHIVFKLKQDSNIDEPSVQFGESDISGISGEVTIECRD